MNNKDKTICAFCCQALDENLRIESSSGGCFTILAQEILAKGGVVYGTSMTSDFHGAEIIKVSEISELYKLRGSKYLQSKNNNSYKEINGLLKDGILVLFSGTPCQVNGLKNYLGREYSNLICIDVICHGVPSPKLWSEYIDFIESRYKGKVSSVNFRCKDNNWKQFGIKENLETRMIFSDHKYDPYMQMFLKNYCLRPSCYDCMAKNYVCSDITLGDFWGVDLFAPEMDDNKGTSIVLVRSIKGLELINNARNKFLIKEISYSDAVEDNPAEYTSVERPLQRNRFFTDMNILPFEGLYIKYLFPKPKHKIKYIFIKIKIWPFIEKLKDFINRVRGRKKQENRRYNAYGLLFGIKDN